MLAPPGVLIATLIPDLLVILHLPRSSGAALVHRRISTQTFRAASVRGNASITAAAPSLQGKQVFCGEDEYVWRVFKVIIREGGVRTLSFGHFGNF